jgi:hypothetical protein
MRRQRGLVGLMGLAALVGLAIIAKPAVAAVTTEESASILVFPKVIANGTRDTVIQITNTSNSMRHAHCFYVDGAKTIPGLPYGPNNPPLCRETDFDIWLTKQQPTHWVVSTGRRVEPRDEVCSGSIPGPAVPCDPSTSGDPTISDSRFANCCDAGIDPGAIPAVAPDFIGELKCIEVDAGGAPEPGNAIKGEATIETVFPVANGDVSKYNAIGLMGNDMNNRDNVLCLGGGVTADCPTGAEYDACPATWILDSPSIGAADRVAEEYLCPGGTTTGCFSGVSTTLTVVPCTENFETQVPTPVTLQFAVTNEFEQTVTFSTTISCFASLELTDINPVLGVGSIGGSILQTQMRSASGSQRGVMAILEETHGATFPVSGSSASFTATAAQNAHSSFQDQPGPDLITIPADQLQDPTP